MSVDKLLWVMNNASASYTRVFSVLSRLSSVKTSGLLLSNEYNPAYHYYATTNRAEIVKQSDCYFHAVFNHKKSLLATIFQALRLNKLFQFFKKKYDIYPIDLLLNDVVWRNFLSQELPACDRNVMIDKQFYFTDMTSTQGVFLNAGAFDLIILAGLANVKVSPQIKTIFYFNDKNALAKTEISELDEYARAHFVCESEAIAKLLVSKIPTSVDRFMVIPDSLPRIDADAAWNALIKQIKSEGKQHEK